MAGEKKKNVGITFTSSEKTTSSVGKGHSKNRDFSILMVIAEKFLPPLFLRF
jgi:hypothetical protein